MIFTLPSNICQLALKCIPLVFKPTKQKTNIGSYRGHTIQTNVYVPQQSKVKLQRWLNSMTLYTRIPMSIIVVTSSHPVSIFKYISNINYFSLCPSLKHIHTDIHCNWQWHTLKFPPKTGLHMHILVGILLCIIFSPIWSISGNMFKF